MNRFFRSAGVYIVILLVTVGIVNFIANQGQETDQIQYNEYKELLNNGELVDITIKPDGGTYLIEGKYAGQEGTFQTRGPLYDGTVIPDLEQAGVNVTFEKEEGPSIWLTFFTSIIPFALVCSKYSGKPESCAEKRMTAPTCQGSPRSRHWRTRRSAVKEIGGGAICCDLLGMKLTILRR